MTIAYLYKTETESGFTYIWKRYLKKNLLVPSVNTIRLPLVKDIFGDILFGKQ